MHREKQSRAPKARQQTTERKKTAVPAWFNEPADATQYLVQEERVYVRMDGREESEINEKFCMTSVEFIQVKRLIGDLRGYAHA